MHKLWPLLAIWLLASPMFPQATSSEWESGTIIAVNPHPGSSSSDPSVKLFDVEIQVRDTLYTVLFTQGPGKAGIEYRVGVGLTVLVKDKTIAYNDWLGETKEAPIIGRKPAPERGQTVPEQIKPDEP